MAKGVASGIVEKITDKEVTTKFGVKKVWSLNVSGEWYGGLWKEPKFSEGDTVEFSTTNRQVGDKTYYSVDGMVNVISSGGGTRPAPSNSSSPTPDKKTTPYKRYNCTCDQFPINPLDRQMSIIIQSSVNRATEIVLAKYNSATAAAQGKLTPEKMWEDISKITDLIAAKASGQDVVDEVMKEKGEKYEEYKKLLAGELASDNTDEKDKSESK